MKEKTKKILIEICKAIKYIVIYFAIMLSIYFACGMAMLGIKIGGKVADNYNDKAYAETIINDNPNNIEFGNYANYTTKVIGENYFGSAVINPTDDTDDHWGYLANGDYNFGFVNQGSQPWIQLTTTNGRISTKRVKQNNINYINLTFELRLNSGSYSVIDTTNIDGITYNRYFYVYLQANNINVLDYSLVGKDGKYYIREMDNVNNIATLYQTEGFYDSVENWVYINIACDATIFNWVTFRSFVPIYYSNVSTTQEAMNRLYNSFNSLDPNFLFGSTIEDAYYWGFKNGQADSYNRIEEQFRDLLQEKDNDLQQLLNYYSSDGEGYMEIYNKGLNSSVSNAWGSSWDFIGTTFSGIGNIMNIEILPNVSLWVFIAIPLFLGLIAFIYKLGGK